MYAIITPKQALIVQENTVQEISEHIVASINSLLALRYKQTGTVLITEEDIMLGTCGEMETPEYGIPELRTLINGRGLIPELMKEFEPVWNVTYNDVWRAWEFEPKNI